MPTEDVLNEMAQMFSDAKSGVREKAGLTPVAGEMGGPLDRRNPGLSFPYDDPQTVKNAILLAMKTLATIRVDIDHIEDGLKTMAPLYGLVGETPSAGQVAPARSVTAGKTSTQIINDAVTSFEMRFAEQAAAAQAATFRDAPAPSPTGWTCPDHPDAEPQALTSRKGRKYGQCSVKGCPQFEPDPRLTKER